MITDEEPPAEEKQPRVDSTLSKGLLILETLSGAARPMGVSELSRQLGLTKSNVFRLLQTLTVLGYVSPTEDKQYRATLKTWQVGRSVVENFNLREIAAPALALLSSETGETIYLAVLEGLNIVYIDKVDSLQPIRSWNPVAGAAPAYCVGTGKAILAAQYTRLRGQLVGNLQKFTDHTLTSIQKLDKEMAVTAARGYAIDRGEFREGVMSFGSAIYLPDGEVVAALGVSVPAVNLKDGDEARICNLVKSAAEDVTSRLALI